MISFLLGIVIWLLRVVSMALLVYCVMSFVMPQSDLMHKAAAYAEPILSPFRQFLHRVIPALRNVPLDFSPLLVWLIIDILIWVLRLLQRIFP